MSTILISNKSYSGNTALPNLIDRITTVDEKTNFLKAMLSGAGVDSSKVNAGNTDSLFNALKSYRSRVVSDGGFIVSMGKTLDALIFANNNSIAAADFAAYSASFGIKTSTVSSNTISKVYDLSVNNADITLVSGGAFLRESESSHDVFKTTGAASYISQKNGILAANGGFVIGTSAHDDTIVGDINNRIRPVYLAVAPSGAGGEHASIEVNQGQTAKLNYIAATNSISTATFTQVGAAYKKYSGLSAVIVDGVTPSFYENGLRMAIGVFAAKSQVGVTVYPSILAHTSNSYLRESWVIRSSSSNLAIELSNYLNKG